MTNEGFPPRRRLRVMLVDDSVTELYLLKKVFALASDMEVVAIATNGREALDLLSQAQPDLVCTDYHMPVMDGLEFIIRAMREHPCTILVMSVAVQSFQKENIFQLLSAGAVDVLAKPIGRAGGIGAAEAQQLLEKVRAIAQAPSLRRRLSLPVAAGPPLAGPGQIPAQISGQIPGLNQAGPGPVASLGRVELVALGASTGGPQILQVILSQLPAQFGVPLVCVQHISEGFLEGMISWLGSGIRLKLELAKTGQTPLPGRVYFAPDGYHLTLDAQRRFLLGPCGGQDLHCPGVDTLFQSVARVYGPAALGVLLTGMGRDGARGLKALRDAGAPTIAQDEGTSVIFGMPAAAIALGAAKYVLPTDGILTMMLRLGGRVAGGPAGEGAL